MAATGTPTPNIGLRIPQGTDPVSVDDINYNSNLIDTKLGAVGNDSVQDQIDSLNSKLKLGSWSGNVTLPYEAPSDGFMTIYLNPSTTSGAYARFSITSANAHAMGLNATGGDGVSISFPIKKGGQVSQAALSNGTYTARFIPIFD